jgi:hypothetical protein
MRLSLLGVAVLALAVAVGETEAAKGKRSASVPRPGMKIQGRLRLLDWKKGQVQVMTGSGLRRFAAPNINVITPGGRRVLPQNCPADLLKPGRMVAVMGGMTQDGEAELTVDMRAEAAGKGMMNGKLRK